MRKNKKPFLLLIIIMTAIIITSCSNANQNSTENQSTSENQNASETSNNAEKTTLETEILDSTAESGTLTSNDYGYITPPVYMQDGDNLKGEKIMYEIEDAVNTVELPDYQITVKANDIISKVTRNIFGNDISCLKTLQSGWRDLSDPRFIENLKLLSPGLTRLWLNNNNMDMSLEEMLEICQKIGSTPLIVLDYNGNNILSLTPAEKDGLFQDNIDRVKELKAVGAQLKYFELGNEIIYTAGAADPEAYARDYVRMRDELKKIDQSYELGANMYAFYDGESYDPKSKKWAPTFFETVGAECDFVSPHFYYGQAVTGADFEKDRFNSDRIIADWSAKIKKAAGTDIPVIVTEWNLWIVNDKVKLGTFAQGMVEADGLFGFAKSGVFGAQIWINQWQNGPDDEYHFFDDTEYGLMRFDTNEFTYAGIVVSELAAEMIGYNVVAASENKADKNINYIALKSDDGKTAKILVANFSVNEEKNIGFVLEGVTAKRITSKTLYSIPYFDTVTTQRQYQQHTSTYIADKSVPEWMNPNAKTDGKTISCNIKNYGITIITCDIGK